MAVRLSSQCCVWMFFWLVSQTRSASNCIRSAVYDRATMYGLASPGTDITEYCFLSGTSMTWSNARTACTSNGYSLAVLNTRDEIAFIWSNTDWFIKNQKYWIGLSCNMSAIKWYDGSPNNATYWAAAPPASCSSTQYVYGDGGLSTQWSLLPANATLTAALCQRAGTVSWPSAYSCGYTTSFTDSTNLVHEYCFIDNNNDVTLTWSQAQGACLSLNYSSLITPTTQELMDNLWGMDNTHFSMSPATYYWMGLSVDTQSDCNSHSYSWLDSTPLSAWITGSGASSWPSCSSPIPPFGPYGCISTQNDASRNWQLTDCTATGYSVICQRVNNCLVNSCVNGATCVDLGYRYICSCAAGYTGVYCQSVTNNCLSVPCQNGANCTNGFKTYSCTCSAGYTGSVCSTVINNCASLPCLNGATCSNGINSYTCNCAAGFTGSRCQTVVNNCASLPCQHSGTCVNSVNYFSCACVAGYTGTLCQTVTDNCASSPCQHSGTCANSVNNFSCACVAGYTGTLCQTVTDNCASSPCQHSGTCANSVNNFSCACVAGYTGTLCQTVTDNCASSPCQHSGTCANSVNNFSCACVAGYTGTLCQTVTDNCASSPCQHSGTCANSVNNFSCACVAGYTGTLCQTELLTTTLTTAIATTQSPTTTLSTSLLTSLIPTTSETTLVTSQLPDTTEVTSLAYSSPVFTTLMTSLGFTSNPQTTDWTTVVMTSLISTQSQTTLRLTSVATSQSITTDVTTGITSQLFTTSAQDVTGMPSFIPVPFNDFLFPGSVPCPDLTVNSPVMVVNYVESLSVATATLACQPGYRFADGAATHLLSCYILTSTWSSSPVACLPITCSPVRVINNGYYDTTNNSIASVVTYTCDVGHVMPDGTHTRTVICLSDQTWSTSIDDCQSVPCAYPITNWWAVHVTGSMMTSQCNAGTAFDTGVTALTAECSARGVWTYTSTSPCYVSTCPPLPYVENAYPDDVSALVGSTNTVYCYYGYHMSTGEVEQNITCLPQLYYTSSFNCIPITCPTSPQLTHATRSTNLALFGTVVQYTCTRGYRFHDNSTTHAIICQNNGQWNNSVTDCQPTACQPSPVIASSINNASQSTVLVLGDVIQYTCNSGMRFADGYVTMNSQCLLDGSWSNQNAHCAGNRCPPYPTFSHTQMFKPQSTDVTNNVLYACDNGYVFADNSVINKLTCGQTLTWQGTIPTCNAIICPTLPTVGQGRWLNGTGAIVGTLASLSCDLGYVTSSDNTSSPIQCVAPGYWSPDVTFITCTAISCGPPRRLGNATYMSDGFTFMSSVHYTCLPGYWFARDVTTATVTCSATGQWNDSSLLPCVDITCVPFPVWEGNIVVNTSSTVYGAVVNVTCCDNTTRVMSQSSVYTCGTYGQWTPAYVTCPASPSSAGTPVVVEAVHSQYYGSVVMAMCGVLLGVLVTLDIASVTYKLSHHTFIGSRRAAMFGFRDNRKHMFIT